MLLGTNEYQNPLILRAKELGYETHVFGWPVGEIGEVTADVYHPVNILDYEALVAEFDKLKPCGVASVCSEIAMHPMNMLLRRMGVPCNSELTEKVTTDKYLMRKMMKEAGIDGPQFMFLEKGYDVDAVRNEVKNFNFPLIAKPTDMSSSRGVFKIDTIDNLREGLDYAFSWSDNKTVILEEFIFGQEYSGDSIAYKGEYKLLAVTEKHTTGAPHFVETGHKQPAPLSSEMYNKVENTLYKVFKALNIEYGAIHPEFRITPDGKVMFMEIATRMGGDCIGTDLVPLSTGYDYMGMVINIGCGKAPDFKKIRKPMEAEIHYVMTESDLALFNKLKAEKPDMIWRSSDIHPISTKPVLKSADRAGYYITIKSLENCSES